MTSRDGVIIDNDAMNEFWIIQAFTYAICAIQNVAHYERANPWREEFKTGHLLGSPVLDQSIHDTRSQASLASR